MNNFLHKTFRIGIDARLWNETGVGRYIRNLVRELQKLDTKNQYVLFALSKDIHEIQLSIFNSQFSIVPTDITWHTIQEQWEFPKILEKEKLDLVHFPYFSVPIWYKGKYVLTIHDLILHHFPTGKASTRHAFAYWLKHAGYKYVIGQAAKKAKKILTVSNATKQEIIKHLHVPGEKIVVAYEGVDTKILNKNTKYQIPNTKYFLYVGNAYPHKNLERLIEGFCLMINDQLSMTNEIKLILVGKEDYFYKRLEEKVKQMKLEDSILFEHDVSDEKLASYYKNALALVSPSLMEGFGLPILEAMAQGCLVAAADIPVFREIAGNIPLYFNPTDTNQLQDVLESIAKGRVIDAKTRKEKGKRHAEEFSWKKMAQKTFEVYQGCLGV